MAGMSDDEDVGSSYSGEEGEEGEERVISGVEVDDGAYVFTSKLETQRENQTPKFAPLTATQMAGGQIESRTVRIPPHRFAPLKANWLQIYTPLVEQMKLQGRVIA